MNPAIEAAAEARLQTVKAIIDKFNLSTREAAKIAGVTHCAVHHWISGAGRPREKPAERLQAWADSPKAAKRRERLRRQAWEPAIEAIERAERIAPMGEPTAVFLGEVTARRSHIPK